MEPMLTVEDVTLRFGGLVALSRIGLEVRAGEVFGIIGPNGAGKSTLFNVIAGVYRPESGRIALQGQAILGRSVAQIARQGLARTFQTPTVFQRESVHENLLRAQLLPRYFRPSLLLGGPRRLGAPRPERIDWALAQVGLEVDAGVLAGSLAYGQQKLLSLAMAIVDQPRLLLMDEPAAGLNSTEKVQMTEVIRKLRDELGITVLVVEHDMKLIMGVCDRILTIAYGSFVAMGTPQEIQNNPHVIEAYLGQEYEFA